MMRWELAKESHPPAGTVVEVIRRDGLQHEWCYYPESFDGCGGNTASWEYFIVFWRYLNEATDRSERGDTGTREDK